jgi:small conductance mechanosensitive channel
MDFAIEGTMSYAPKVIWALLTLWIGFKLINFAVKLADKWLTKAKIDAALKKFIESMISAILKVLLLLTVAWMLGIQTTSFIAILWAAWLAIGMALSGTLQNFAWGVMILLFKPFKIWDFVEVGGNSWVVEEIQIFNTYLLTADKRTIIIPNSEISWKTLINYTTVWKRLVEFNVWVAYNEDTDNVKNTLEEIAKKDERVLQKEGINIFLSELADSAVIFKLRVVVETPDYWPVYFSILEDIKRTFDEKWISFPFPQRDVHIYNEK